MENEGEKKRKKKKDRAFSLQSYLKITGLLPFSGAPTLSVSTDTQKQSEEKRQRQNAYNRLNMVKKTRRKRKE